MPACFRFENALFEIRSGFTRKLTYGEEITQTIKIKKWLALKPFIFRRSTSQNITMVIKGILSNEVSEKKLGEDRISIDHDTEFQSAQHGLEAL